jgi:beta-phosphoglucomutase-like phosphatase (HAD superfamily)
MKPAVVFLDWDGTVCGSRFWGHWSDDGVHTEANALIQNHFFQTSPKILTEWMRGDWDAEKIVTEIARRTDVPAKELLAGLKESCERMQLFDNGILTVIARLREKNIKVVVATDNMDTFTRWTVPALELKSHFDSILDSYSLRALKSDKNALGKSRFFAGYFVKNSIDPSTTILVDDGAHNGVVQDFGIRYIQVTPHSSALSILSSINNSLPNPSKVVLRN